MPLPGRYGLPPRPPGGAKVLGELEIGWGGHAKAVIAAFLGHMVFGALLGPIAGHAETPVAPVASRT